jgi:hypothetical protein
MRNIEAEAIQLTALVRASEDWSSEYAKDPATHAKLLRSEARLQVELTKYFRDIAADIIKYIRWQGYLNQLPQKLDDQNPNYNVDVIVQDVPMDKYDGTFIKVVFQEMAILTAIGSTAGENIYRVPLGIQSTDAIIQQLTTEHVANLVGKKVLKDGSIVDNPKATYRISDKIRADIAQSIKTSLNVGDDIQAATDRLKDTVMGLDNNRAKIIAQTESVNAYTQGLLEFAVQSNAVGKQWMAAGAVDNCALLAADDPIPIDQEFDYDGGDGPPLHPRCKCALRLIYQQEWDKLNI